MAGTERAGKAVVKCPHDRVRRHPDGFECMDCGGDIGWLPLNRRDR